MVMDRLPILQPVMTGYRDTLNAAFAMWPLAVIAIVIVLMSTIFDIVVPLRQIDGSFFGSLLSFILNAVQSFFLVPVMIAVHRFIILDEVTPRYVLDPGGRIFRAFFGWLLALSALSLLVTVVLTPINLPLIVSATLIIAGIITVLVVMVRLTILFPAIAVDAPGATAANAWADSKGHGFGIFLIFLLAVLPLMLVVVAVVFTLGFGERVGLGLGFVSIVIIGIAQAFFIMLCVAIASRLFQALAGRLVADPGK